MECSACGSGAKDIPKPTAFEALMTPAPDSGVFKATLCHNCTRMFVNFVLTEHQRKTGMSARMMIEQFLNAVQTAKKLEKEQTANG
jgi:hypothetical protein